MLTVETDSANYFGQEMHIVVKVTSDESGNEATTDFILTLRDYCYGTELTAPSFTLGPADVDVWSTELFTFEAASESIGQCGSISYEVVGISDSSLYSISGTTITLSPTLLSQAGTTYEFTIRATLDDYGLSVESAPTSFAVIDPCESTSIVSAALSPMSTSVLVG